jgi:hypothetical protein
VKIAVLLTIIVLLAGCQIKTFYPLAGAALGGGVGAIGGPATAALGAVAGSAVGEVAKGDADLMEAREEIQALTTGDVEKLLEIRMRESQGGFSKAMSGIYRVLMIFGVLLVGFSLAPTIYTRYVQKGLKQLHKNLEGRDEGTSK